MNIWLITVGEPLPIDGKGERLHRAGILSEYLVEAGHSVVWWSSTFDHINKRQRFAAYTELKLENGVDLRLLHGCGYRRNISVARIRDHRQIAQQFSRLAAGERKPDIILVSYPTIELSVEAVRYARRAGVPVVVDIRDLWPEIFLEVVPRWARPLLNIVLQPLWREAREAFSKADALTGNSPQFVSWGQELAGRSPRPQDRHFPFGYVTTAPQPAELDAAYEFWRRHGVVASETTHVVCFFGAFSHQFDLGTVVDAARRLSDEGQSFQFVLCGKGEQLDELKERAKNQSNIIFPGWVGRAEILTLMKLSSAGLAPYVNHVGFTGNLPNKPIEYLAGGLPVVTCLDGYLRTFLAEHDCGVFYAPGNAGDLSSVLFELMKDEPRRARMVANARATFDGEFDANTVYRGMVAYLESMAAVSPI